MAFIPCLLDEEHQIALFVSRLILEMIDDGIDEGQHIPCGTEQISTWENNDCYTIEPPSPSQLKKANIELVLSYLKNELSQKIIEMANDIEEEISNP